MCSASLKLFAIIMILFAPLSPRYLTSERSQTGWPQAFCNNTASDSSAYPNPIVFRRPCPSVHRFVLPDWSCQKEPGHHGWHCDRHIHLELPDITPETHTMVISFRFSMYGLSTASARAASGSKIIGSIFVNHLVLSRSALCKQA